MRARSEDEGEGRLARASARLRCASDEEPSAAAGAAAEGEAPEDGALAPPLCASSAARTRCAKKAQAMAVPLGGMRPVSCSSIVWGATGPPLERRSIASRRCDCSLMLDPRASSYACCPMRRCRVRGGRGRKMRMNKSHA